MKEKKKIVFFTYTNGDILCSIKLTNGELNSVLDIINSENHVTFERILIKNQLIKILVD
jgi:hypothetical protein